MFFLKHKVSLGDILCFKSHPSWSVGAQYPFSTEFRRCSVLCRIRRGVPQRSPIARHLCPVVTPPLAAFRARGAAANPVQERGEFRLLRSPPPAPVSCKPPNRRGPPPRTACTMR